MAKSSRIYLPIKLKYRGLVYSALPMGAVPEGYDKIVLLDGINLTPS